jgi:hypothetical protein
MRHRPRPLAAGRLERTKTQSGVVHRIPTIKVIKFAMKRS